MTEVARPGRVRDPWEDAPWTSKSTGGTSGTGEPWSAIPSPLAQGEARLRIDRFGFSSNNVTYAVLGHLFHYWDYFPPSAADTPDRIPWGRVPRGGSPR